MWIVLTDISEILFVLFENRSLGLTHGKYFTKRLNTHSSWYGLGGSFGNTQSLNNPAKVLQQKDEQIYGLAR